MTERSDSPKEFDSFAGNAVGDPNGSVLTDDELVVAIRLRDEDALAETYSRYGASIYRCAVRLCGHNSGEEVTHQVFLDLWDNPTSFDRKRGSLYPQLLAAAHTQAVRRSRNESIGSADELTAEAGHHAKGSAALALSANESVRSHLAGLSDPEREAVLLAYFGGYSCLQIANRLRQSELSVKRNLRGAMSKLRGFLTAEWPNSEHSDNYQ